MLSLCNILHVLYVCMNKCLTTMLFVSLCFFVFCMSIRNAFIYVHIPKLNAPLHACICMCVPGICMHEQRVNIDCICRWWCDDWIRGYDDFDDSSYFVSFPPFKSTLNEGMNEAVNLYTSCMTGRRSWQVTELVMMTTATSNFTSLSACKSFSAFTSNTNMSAKALLCVCVCVCVCVLLCVLCHIYC